MAAVHFELSMAYREDQMSHGIAQQQAPELRVGLWFDPLGKPRSALKLSDLGPGHKILYCFQAWCHGCHATGFPALQKLVQNLSVDSGNYPSSDSIKHGFGFAAIQTVFEGQDQNTPDKPIEMQQRYGLKIPFGHDQSESGYPSVMQDYRTGGTPWFIVIDPNGLVIFNDFGIDANALIDQISRYK